MKLSKAICYITAVVLLWEATFEFVWEHRSFFSGVLVTCIAGLFIYSVKRANSNANQ